MGTHYGPSAGRRRSGGETDAAALAGTVRARRFGSSICVGCGTEYPPAAAPPGECPICNDPRLRSPRAGWTSLEELRRCHEPRIDELEPGLVAIGIEPSFALAQRALLADGLLWDCVPFLDGELAELVDSRGGLRHIAISHPHGYGGMSRWAREFGARILVHEADADLVVDRSAPVDYWSGDRLDLDPHIELHRLGGPFPGATACLWKPGADGLGALLLSGPAHVAPSCAAVTFTWRYGDMLPLSPSDVRRIGDLLGTLTFDRIYGCWWDRTIASDARRILGRSVERYLAAVREPAPTDGRRRPG